MCVVLYFVSDLVFQESVKNKLDKLLRTRDNPCSLSSVQTSQFQVIQKAIPHRPMDAVDAEMGVDDENKIPAFIWDEKDYEVPHSKGNSIKQNKEQHTFESNKAVLFNNKIVRIKNRIIKKTHSTEIGEQSNIGYQMITLEVSKIGLDNWSDKRLRLDMINTKPYGMEPYDGDNTPVEDKFITNMRTRARDKKLPWSMELLGCTKDEFKTHIEKQLRIGMCWRNYGLPTEQGGWELDHIIPASFKTKPE